MLTIVLLAILTLFPSALLQAETPFTIAVPKDVYVDYQRLTNKREAVDMTDYQGAGSRRDVVEVVLMIQALHLGQFSGKIEIVAFDGYKRTLQMLQQGRLGAIGPSAWNSEKARADKTLLLSDVLIKEGEFEAGLFTSVENKRALAVTSFAELKDFTAVSSRNWGRDWALLEQLRMKHIQHTLHWTSMVKMIGAGRADIVLAPFPNTDNLHMTVGEITLAPIRNLKVSLPGSRSWIVSRKHSEGEAAFAAIERGLKILRIQGRVRKAYSDAGFINRKTRDWLTVKSNSIPKSGP